MWGGCLAQQLWKPRCVLSTASCHRPSTFVSGCRWRRVCRLFYFFAAFLPGKVRSSYLLPVVICEVSTTVLVVAVVVTILLLQHCVQEVPVVKDMTNNCSFRGCRLFCFGWLARDNATSTSTYIDEKRCVSLLFYC